MINNLGNNLLSWKPVDRFTYHITCQMEQFWWHRLNMWSFYFFHLNKTWKLLILTRLCQPLNHQGSLFLDSLKPIYSWLANLVCVKQRKNGKIFPNLVSSRYIPQFLCWMNWCDGMRSWRRNGGECQQYMASQGGSTFHREDQDKRLYNPELDGGEGKDSE